MLVRVCDARVEIDETLVKNKTKKEIERDIYDYLRHKRRHFADYEIDVKPFTPFQRRVLLEMRHIPLGITVSYKRLAELVGRPRAYRAVANVCAANPLPIIVPCHRVVGSYSLGGYSGGLNIKKKLLRIEM
ncbi:MAG: methylated-DNA--[protein]-cysteine S-methyltransferase [Candidatus Aenigmarchaeota archaeon]|nr:methylated-DNA--[protein]-cysteine S-methyltransferase [Candidatus Aenigmarchaeota archaeon]